MEKSSTAEAGISPDGEFSRFAKPSPAGRWLPALAWVVALSLLGVAVYLGWRALIRQPVVLPLKQTQHLPAETAILQKDPAGIAQAAEEANSGASAIALPELKQFNEVQAVPRRIKLHTSIPTRTREEVRDYIVDTGDSVFEIAANFKIKPETVLWANYDQLNDNPDLISKGMTLKIPPVDGVYYQWQAGDTLESVAARFEAKPEAMLEWSGNGFDLVEPQAEPGTWVLVPGGHREFRQWIIPTIPRGRAGVSRSVYGEGACDGGYEGAYGSGSFIWPAGNHYLSGNDYWSGHLGIDIAAGEGAPIYAADSGVVVFAGWATGGYGYMVMIDHGNGYQTLYGHMSSIGVGCGRSVGQGGVIGYAGSTGNSTGAHLHFEVRYQGGFINPWYVLPAP